MRLQITPICGGRKVELRETRRAVTPFGGLVVFGEFLGKIGYAEAVRKHLPFRLTSPNAIDPVQTFTAFLLSVLAGARRFAHTGLLRADQALQQVLGIRRFPSDDTIRNWFKRFGQGQNYRFYSALTESAQARSSLASPFAGGFSGSALHSAWLAAQWELRDGARGGGISERSAGAFVGGSPNSESARGRRIL